MLERATRMCHRVGGICSERHEPDLARSAPGTQPELAVDDDSHPDSGPDGDADEVVEPTGCTLPALAERGEVYVVAHRDLDAETVG